ncbi:MAG: redox-sensing transcriptional repressor Rex [Bacteroidota bacterium]
MEIKVSIPKKSLKRLVHYQFYLKQLLQKDRDFVSNERLAVDLNLSIAEVREDLENFNESLSVSDIHSVDNLLKNVEKYLGHDNTNKAVIVGAGNLGKALLGFSGFLSFGLDIFMVFDNDDQLISQKLNGKEVFSVSRLEELTRRLNIDIGIITTPPEPAQEIANTLIRAGVKGIWNFSPAVIKVPDHIMLKNTSLFSDYMSLVHKMNKVFVNT